MIVKSSKYGHKTKPFDHQEAEFIRSRSMPYYAGFWEMGTGKSKLIIDTCGYLYSMKEIDGVIIVGDKGNYRNWYSEIDTHLPTNIDRRAMHWPSHKDEIFQAKDDCLDFFLVNVEALSGPRAEVACAKFLQGHYALMCVDEATSIKNRTAHRTKAIIRLGKKADYRRILTGTPITQGPLDLYSMCEFLERELLGFPTFVSFRSHYSIMKKMYLGPNRPTFDVVIGYKNLDDLTMSIAAFSSRITKDECLDLPPKIYEIVHVEMTPEQKCAYESLKSQAIVKLDQGLLTVTSALTAVNKLQQICCGHLKLDDDIQVDIPCNRLDDLIGVLDTIGIDKKVIIWCAFQRDVEQIVARIIEWKKTPKCLVTYYGKTPDNERQGNLDKFTNMEECLYFIGTAATGGKGLTLTCASYVVYYSNSYSLEDRLQSEDRAHRIGQLSKVTYIDLIIKDAIDEKVHEILKSKKDLAYQILDKVRELLS